MGRPKKTWEKIKMTQYEFTYRELRRGDIGSWQIILAKNCCLMCLDDREELSLSFLLYGATLSLWR